MASPHKPPRLDTGKLKHVALGASSHLFVVRVGQHKLKGKISEVVTDSVWFCSLLLKAFFFTLFLIFASLASGTPTATCFPSHVSREVPHHVSVASTGQFMEALVSLLELR